MVIKIAAKVLKSSHISKFFRDKFLTSKHTAHLPSYFLKYTRTRGGSYRFSWAAGQLGSKITFFRIKTCIYPQIVVLLWHNCYYSPHKMM